MNDADFLGDEGELDMLETEKATDKFDLPHTYDRIHRDQNECICGRKKDHQIHQAVMTEQAAHSAPLQTEKGS